jgi:two-component system, NtrC family, sensor histidine kinase GlrK
LYRPKSIVRLILFGFAAVGTPLIVAVVTALVEVDELAEQSQAAVLEAEIATQQSRSLMEHLTEMQRALGQFQVLGDGDFYEIYSNRRQAFLNAIDNLMALRTTETATAELERLRAEEQALFESLHAASDGARAADDVIDEKWAHLASRARNVLAESSKLIEDQAGYATRAADRLQRTLLLQAAAVIPATIVLAALFTILITRPMGQIGEGIRRLGGRQFADPIEVHGPRDVEELGRQLDWLRKRIQKLEQQKITFVRHISHELKTPLTTLREGAELLVESLAKAAPEDAEISRLMRDNSLRLQALIENLLQFGKTQDPITDLKLEPVALEEVIRSVIESQGVAAVSKEITVDHELAVVRIVADASKVRTVVDNLLTNAIKYTPQGGRVSVSLAARSDFAIVDVRDTGPGIAHVDRDRIFEPFYQGLTEYQSSVKGTGLGLAIAKEYVEAHHGFIELVGSEQGAHFRVGFRVSGPSGVEPRQ